MRSNNIRNIQGLPDSTPTSLQCHFHTTFFLLSQRQHQTHILKADIIYKSSFCKIVAMCYSSICQMNCHHFRMKQLSLQPLAYFSTAIIKMTWKINLICLEYFYLVNLHYSITINCLSIILKWLQQSKPCRVNTEQYKTYFCWESNMAGVFLTNKFRIFTKSIIEISSSLSTENVLIPYLYNW